MKQDVKQLVAILLTLLIANPSQFGMAASADASRTVIGSIESHGTVRVGEISAAKSGTLFEGDRVQVGSGNAVIQYRQGSRVTLGVDSAAEFTPAGVRLEKGFMSLRTQPNDGVTYMVSTLHVVPTSAATSANVTLLNRRANLAVKEGGVRVLDEQGTQIASIASGGDLVFEQPSTNQQDSASRGSQSGSPNSTSGNPAGTRSKSNKWVVVTAAAAAVGIGAGIAVAATHGNGSSSIVRTVRDLGTTTATQLTSAETNFPANTELKTLQTQLATLQSQLQSSGLSQQQADEIRQRLIDIQNRLQQIVSTCSNNTVSPNIPCK